MSTDHPEPFRLFSKPVVSWALYDFANTIFSLAIVTRFFNAWVIEDRGRPDWYIAVMGLIVAVGLVLTMPPLGAIADRLGRRKPFLVFFTLLCVTMTALLPAVDNILLALVVAGLAIFGFQSALAHYDPMLATVAPREAHGRVSGFGVGLGYVGAILGLIVLQYGFVGNDPTADDPNTPIAASLPFVGHFFETGGANQNAFIPTAILFLLFALPCFAFVREGERRKLDASLRSVVRDSMMQLRHTIAQARRYSSTGRFLLARFLYADAVLVLITYMKVYAGRVSDYSNNTEVLLMLVATVFAIIAAFLTGRAVERFGPKKPLVMMLSLFAPTLVITALVQQAWILWLAGPIVGATLGSMWTADRVFMMRLSPPAFRGEFFSLYNLIGKASSGIGPAVFWGGLTWLTHEKTGLLTLEAASRLSLVLLAGVTVAGLLVLRPLSDVEPEWTDAERGLVAPAP